MEGEGNIARPAFLSSAPASPPNQGDNNKKEPLHSTPHYTVAGISFNKPGELITPSPDHNDTTPGTTVRLCRG